MIRTSGGPLPTDRYPTAPRLVWAIRTGADTTDSTAGVAFGAEPHALSAAHSSATTRAKAPPRRAVMPSQYARGFRRLAYMYIMNI